MTQGLGWQSMPIAYRISNNILNPLGRWPTVRQAAQKLGMHHVRQQGPSYTCQSLSQYYERLQSRVWRVFALFLGVELLPLEPGVHLFLWGVGLLINTFDSPAEATSAHNISHEVAFAQRAARAEALASLSVVAYIVLALDIRLTRILVSHASGIHAGWCIQGLQTLTIVSLAHALQQVWFLPPVNVRSFQQPRMADK